MKNNKLYFLWKCEMFGAEIDMMDKIGFRFQPDENPIPNLSLFWFGLPWLSIHQFLVVNIN